MTPKVNDASRARIEADERAARAAGFAPRPPVFAAGTEVLPEGRARFARSRRAFEDLPHVRELADRVAGRVEAEQRADRRIAWRDLRFDPAARLLLDGDPVALEATAQAQVSDRLARGTAGSAYLLSVPPALRAVNWQALAARADRRDMALLRLRRRSPREPLQGFAVVTDRYAVFEADRVARALAAAVPHEARGEVVYDGTRWSLQALWHAPRELEGFAAGDFFKAGVQCRTADDGTSAVHVEAVVFRNLCLNLLVVDEAVRDAGSVRHSGAPEAVQEALSEAVGRAFCAVRRFRDRWVAAERDEVLRRIGVEEAIARMCERRLVALRGVPPARLAGRILHAWQAEPGFGLTALVNAVTRAAHEAPWPGVWDAQALERQAGRLLVSGARLEDPWEPPATRRRAASVDAAAPDRGGVPVWAGAW